MEPLLQKSATQLPETFHKEPTKKSSNQNPSKWNPKTIALATLSTLGASLLAYQYASPKIKIPDSSVSSPFYSAFKFVGSLTALATVAGLISSNTSNRNTCLQKHKPLDKSNNTKPLNVTGSEENPEFISSTEIKSQTTLDITPSKQKPTHHDIEKILALITAYNDLNKTSPEETFISEITNLILEFENSFWKHNSSLDEKKSNLNKMIDVLNVLTERTDLLSCMLVEQLFSDQVIPTGLHDMTQVFIDEQDEESKELVELSCQLVYKALDQQMKILFSEDLDFKSPYAADGAFQNILALLIPFENDHFRLSPNFYANFIQRSPQFAWRFAQNYLLESIIKKEITINFTLYPDYIIASILNKRNSNSINEFSIPYTEKDGLGVLNKMLGNVKLSLFLENQDKGAASFAIRLMQHKLSINPEKFEESDQNAKNDLETLYNDLCSTIFLKPFNDFAIEKGLSKKASLIASELINERRRTIVINLLLGTDVTQYRQSFLNKIIPLHEKNEFSKEELQKNVQLLSHFIRYQMIDPSIPQRVELAVLALNEYTKIFLNEDSVKIIRGTYKNAKLAENSDLDLACQNLFKAWDNEPNSKILEIENLETKTENLETIYKQKVKELCKKRPGTPVKLEIT